MTSIQKFSYSIAVVAAFVSGFFVGRNTGPLADGAFFCCDDDTKPCVYAPDGDCEVPLQWCSETRNVNGTVTCAQW